MSQITKDELRQTLLEVPRDNPLEWFKTQPKSFQQKIALLIRTESVDKASAAVKAVIAKEERAIRRSESPTKAKRGRPHGRVIVLNRRGSIAAKLVLVQKAEKNRFWTELLINTEYGPISVKSPRSDVKYLTLFIEDEKIVSQSLSLSLNAIKSSIVIKEYTHEKAIAYVYDLAITYGSEESPQIDPVQKLESKKDVKRLIKTKSIEIAKASQTRIAIVLNRRGSITGKLVIVPGVRKGSFATELLIDTEYGPVSIKSPRAEAKHLVLFVENEKKIVASSLSLNIDRVKATIGFKRTSYRNAISYVYDLTIEQALSA